jgi:beta-lactamase class A
VPSLVEGGLMERSRRQLIGGAAATVGAALIGGSSASAARKPVTSDAIRELFAPLPGTNSIRIVAAATDRTSALDVSMDPGQQLFIGSAFKAFVAAEALRQDDSPNVVDTISQRQLALDESVWSPDSATFNPPHLSGQVSERTALEAMVLHSDNTGADMVLKQVGPDNVRAFIASAGLTKTLIPDSTRSFIGYLFGVPDPDAFTWADFEAIQNQPYVNPALNETNTMASSADDLVSFYSRALPGSDFFQNEATSQEFRELLSIGDIIWILPFPLAVSAFSKGGEIDMPGFHALCAAGGIFFDDVWAFFAFTINWPSPEQSDPVTQEAWATACAQALQLVKDALQAPGAGGGELPATL